MKATTLRAGQDCRGALACQCAEVVPVKANRGLAGCENQPFPANRTIYKATGLV